VNGYFGPTVFLNFYPILNFIVLKEAKSTELVA